MQAIEVRDVNKGVVFINIEHIISIEPRSKDQERDKNKCGSYIRVIGDPTDDYEVAKNPCEVMSLIETRVGGFQYTMDLDAIQRQMSE